MRTVEIFEIEFHAEDGARLVLMHDAAHPDELLLRLHEGPVSSAVLLAVDEARALAVLTGEYLARPSRDDLGLTFREGKGSQIHFRPDVRPEPHRRVLYVRHETSDGTTVSMHLGLDETKRLGMVIGPLFQDAPTAPPPR